MTPAARVAAAIDILDAVLDGLVAEQAVSRWARGNRYAGSKDRAAVRDHVFDALRCKRSFAWLGGAETGRGLMIGASRARGDDPAVLFDGSLYGPPIVSEDETGKPLEMAPRGVRLDMPEWLLPLFDEALEEPDATMAALKDRANVFLRVNLGAAEVEDTQKFLAEDGIATTRVDNVKTALLVTENPRKVAHSRAYESGWVEVQDSASQAAIERLPLRDGMRVLDLCAGGGGKALAMAALADLQIEAHDIDPRRMADLGPRAQRAGASITQVTSDALRGPYDLILIDAPCSGSGTWRRAPEAKWALTAERLQQLTEIQEGLLEQAAQLVSPTGVIAYATCSVFDCENRMVVSAFQDSNPTWAEVDALTLAPAALHDGFYLSVLTRMERQA